MRPFTNRADVAMRYAESISVERAFGYVGTEHLLYGLLKEGGGVAAGVLLAQNVSEERLVNLIDEVISPGGILLEDRNGNTPSLTKVLDIADRQAGRYKFEEIGTEHLLIGILFLHECAAYRLLNTLGVNLQKMYTDILVAMGEDVSKHKHEFQNGRPVSRDKGTDTPMLNRFASDLTQMAKDGELDHVIGREDEISRMMLILSRRLKNNPCLLGESGVGKTSVVEGLAIRISSENVPKNLIGKRILTLDLSGMVAGTKYRGEFEERIKRLIEEVKNDPSIMLFIDELHTLIGAGGAEGSLDASNILKPSLARGNIRVIGATTLNEYRKYVEKDKALERRFQPVTVEEPTVGEALEILEGVKDHYEAHHGVEISGEALSEAVRLSDRYINDRFLPDKAIDLIDEASAQVGLKGYGESSAMNKLREDLRNLEGRMEDALKGGRFDEASDLKKQLQRAKGSIEKERDRARRNASSGILTVEPSDVAQVVSRWTKIPLKQLTEEESKKLLKLEDELHKRVIGQNEAVTSVSRAIKRGRVGLKDKKRPIGSFLFLGPTGVGKTELSKALAEAVFGDESSLIRVDMSEYMERHSVSKMIGSPPGYVGYDDGGQLSEKVRRNPYSVILFDEIEKAHPDVFNVLLQVLDDGHITDAQGRKIDFKNTVIIMTSNAGAKYIVEPKKLGFGALDEDEEKDYERMKGNVMEEVRRIFKPEFLNRIGEIIVFHSLNKDDLKLSQRCKQNLGILLSVKDEAVEKIVEEAYDPKYGARPLRRKMESMIEDPLAEKILSMQIKRGDEIMISVEGDEIQIVQ